LASHPSHENNYAKLQGDEITQTRKPSVIAKLFLGQGLIKASVLIQNFKAWL
jgi:hypothetical protein